MGKLAITGGKPLRKTPFTQWPYGGKQEMAALADVLKSTKWGGQPFPGKHSTVFQNKFAKLHTVKYAQCVNTGTVAIQAALKAVGVMPGDEVIVPAYTWEGTVGPVLLLNLQGSGYFLSGVLAWLSLGRVLVKNGGIVRQEERA